MSDLLFILLTVLGFAVIALLVGVLDRRLSQDGGDR